MVGVLRFGGRAGAGCGKKSGQGVGGPWCDVSEVDHADTEDDDVGAEVGQGIVEPARAQFSLKRISGSCGLCPASDIADPGWRMWAGSASSDESCGVSSGVVLVHR